MWQFFAVTCRIQVKIQFNYEQDLDINLDVLYLDSDSEDAYVIQAADYVANAVWTKYEYGYDLYADRLKNKFLIQEKFPYRKFGMWYQKLAI